MNLIKRYCGNGREQDITKFYTFRERGIAIFLMRLYYLKDPEIIDWNNGASINIGLIKLEY